MRTLQSITCSVLNRWHTDEWFSYGVRPRGSSDGSNGMLKLFVNSCLGQPVCDTARFVPVLNRTTTTYQTL